MEFVLTLLNRLRPSGTSAVSMFSPLKGEQVILRKLYISNVGGNKAKYSVFITDDSSTYDETTAIFFEIEIEKETTVVILLDIPLRDSDGDIGVQTDTGDELNFTLTGDK